MSYKLIGPAVDFSEDAQYLLDNGFLPEGTTLEEGIRRVWGARTPSTRTTYNDDGSIDEYTTFSDGQTEHRRETLNDVKYNYEKFGISFVYEPRNKFEHLRNRHAYKALKEAAKRLKFTPAALRDIEDVATAGD